MELFILLVLSFCCCQAVVPPEGEDVHCDDPEVFSAVDLAVKAYNEDQKDGNLFALKVILAACRTVGLGKNFHIQYQLMETSCPLRGSVSWQNCEFLPPSEGDSGECSAEIHTDDNLVYSSVSQTCRITTASEKVTRSHAGCLGCWHSISRKSKELVPILKQAVQQYNNESDQPRLFDAVGVITATRQVVAGWKYKFDYWITETNCSKADFLGLTPECKPTGHIGTCHVESYVDFRDTIVNVEQECQLEDKNCPGCPRTIPPDSPQLKELLQVILEKYNTDSSDEFLYRITNVTKATVQVVSGIMYRIDFEIKKTNCSKDENRELRDNCATLEENQLVRRPPGFTPFRMAVMISSTAATGTAGEGLSNTQYRGCRRGHKQGHNKTKLKSSEESQEHAKNQDEILPTAVTLDPLEQKENVVRNPDEDGFLPQDGTVPQFSLFDRLPDLPEPPAPKCPGKPWKPIILPTTPAPEPGDFVLEDLLPGEGDVAEPQETAPASSQADHGEFDLADALS